MSEEDKAACIDGIPDDILVTKVVTYTLLGQGQHKIAKTITDETGVRLNYKHIKAVQDRPEFKALMQKLGEDILATAKQRLKQEASRMVTETMRVIRHHLTNDNLQAVPHVLKILGVESEEKAVGQQNLTIVMPNTQPEKPVILAESVNEIQDSKGDE